MTEVITEYYENKNKKIEMSEEYIREYYEDEKLKKEWVKNKEYKTFYPNGKLKEQCELLEMQLHGWLMSYDEDGDEVARELYREGEQIGKYPFNKKEMNFVI